MAVHKVRICRWKRKRKKENCSPHWKEEQHRVKNIRPPTLVNLNYNANQPPAAHQMVGDCIVCVHYMHVQPPCLQKIHFPDPFLVWRAFPCNSVGQVVWVGSSFKDWEIFVSGKCLHCKFVGVLLRQKLFDMVYMCNWNLKLTDVKFQDYAVLELTARFTWEELAFSTFQMESCIRCSFNMVFTNAHMYLCTIIGHCRKDFSCLIFTRLIFAT